MTKDILNLQKKTGVFGSAGNIVSEGENSAVGLQYRPVPSFPQCFHCLGLLKLYIRFYVVKELIFKKIAFQNFICQN